MHRGHSLTTITTGILALFLALPAFAWSPLALRDDPLVRMPGTQPNQGVVMTGPNGGNEPNGCTDCHGDGENPSLGGILTTPGFFWQGSMMAQAARDPIFWATMTVAAQDSIWALGRPNATDICLRCHFPEGWLGGRSSGLAAEGINASLMSGSDFDGVHCDVCHKMWDPFFATTFGPRESNDPAFWEEAVDLSAEAAATTAADQALSPGIRLFSGLDYFLADRPRYATYESNGGGQLYVGTDPDHTNKRASFADVTADHTVLYSRYHKSRFFCSTCHDVSNPALANLGLSALADQSGGADLITEQYDAGKYAHVERTFSEFLLSAYGRGTGAATNAEFQSQGAPTITHAARCQDCHMNDVAGQGGNLGLPRPRGAIHPDAGSPLHNLQGGNLWMTRILASVDPDGPVSDPVNAQLLNQGPALLTLDMTAGLPPTQLGGSTALLDASDRAAQQLRLAATLQNPLYDPATGALSFRIQNNTGHKLISGYPEGRRMYVGIKAFRGVNPFPIFEVNPYDGAAGTLKGLSHTYTTGTQELPRPAAINPAAESYDDELVYEMHARSDLTGEPKTFHFVLATGRAKDNRIPPKGFDIAAAPTRLSEPVWHGQSAPAYFTPAEYAGGYDQVNLKIAPGADRVEVTLYYQGTSREYVEFLRDEINGTDTTLTEPTHAQNNGFNGDADRAYLIQTDPFFAGLKAWGDTIWTLWKHNHGLDGAGAPVPGLTPFAMTSVVAAPAQSVDSDGDGLADDVELVLGLDPFNPDTDGDGTNDGQEDADGDGLANADEIGRGTDPLNPDSDGDGLADGAEVAIGTDPLNPDSDGDGLADGADPNPGGSGPGPQFGVFRPEVGEWFFDRNGSGQWEDCQSDGCFSQFGAPGDRGVVGDWDGTGARRIGVFRPATGQWFLDRNGDRNWSGCLEDGGQDLCVPQFGAPGDLPVAADIDGDGSAEVGVFRPSSGQWFFDLDNDGWSGCRADGGADLCLAQFGAPGDLPVVGDIDGDLQLEVGVYRPVLGRWFFDLDHDGLWGGCQAAGGTDGCSGQFGVAGDLPLLHAWTGTGSLRIGVYRPATGEWFFDLNGDQAWNGCNPDGCFGQFGASQDQPLAGRWGL